MKNAFFLLTVLLITGGCISDPDAELAAAIYYELHSGLPKSPITLDSALEKCDASHHSMVRIAFAQMQLARLERSPENILNAEKSRIRLNTCLGYLPGDSIPYDLESSLECPAEPPPVTTAEKAALIIDQGQSRPLQLLCKVRLAHADAVMAMNQKKHTPGHTANLNYFIACVKLSEAIGIPLEQLDKLENYEKRFDAAGVSWEKNHLWMIGIKSSKIGNFLKIR